MRRFSKVWFVAGSAVLLTTFPAGAVVPLTAPPLPERVALADLIALGKVTALEKELIHAGPLLKIPGVTNKVSYRIAVVAVETPVLGAKDAKQVRIAFQPPPKEGNKPGRGTARYAVVQLHAGQAGCFFLRKHPDEPFYVLQAAYDVIDKKEKGSDKEIAQVKHCAELLGDVMAGLQAKKAEDRFLTASMLIYRYRTPRYIYKGRPATEAIDAKQSKQILAALAEADWKDKDAPASAAPLGLFLRLGLTPRDGWKLPEKLTDVAPAARQWLKEHGESYRIQRYVPPPP